MTATVALVLALVAQDSVAKDWTSAGGTGAVVEHREPGGVRRLVVRFEGGVRWRRVFEFVGDRLVAASEEQDGVIDRYAFTDDVLVRWLHVTADGTEYLQDPEDAAWLDAGRQVPARAACWQAFLAVAEPDWDVWGEDSGCAYL